MKQEIVNQSKQYYCYMMTSQPYGTIYVGVTSDLLKRVAGHREGLSHFTKRYDVKDLVWFEVYQDVYLAIQREKQIKHWNRDWKVQLIEEENPEWADLYPALNGFPRSRE